MCSGLNLLLRLPVTRLLQAYTTTFETGWNLDWQHSLTHHVPISVIERYGRASVPLVGDAPMLKYDKVDSLDSKDGLDCQLLRDCPDARTCEAERGQNRSSHSLVAETSRERRDGDEIQLLCEHDANFFFSC